MCNIPFWYNTRDLKQNMSNTDKPGPDYASLSHNLEDAPLLIQELLKQAPVLKVPKLNGPLSDAYIGDPFVLPADPVKHGNKYYCFGTSKHTGTMVIFESTSMDGPWAEIECKWEQFAGQFIWAPEVIYGPDGHLYCVCSIGFGHDQHLHLLKLNGDNPTQILEDTNLGQGTDPTIFYDDKGYLCILHCAIVQPNQAFIGDRPVNAGSQIVGRKAKFTEVNPGEFKLEIEDSPSSVVLRPYAPWQIVKHFNYWDDKNGVMAIIEGVSILKVPFQGHTLYYMIFSGGSWEEEYGIACLVAVDDPFGPYYMVTDSYAKPNVLTNEEYHRCGHASVGFDSNNDNQPYIVAHVDEGQNDRRIYKGDLQVVAYA
jgi:hypothetical protein